MPSNIALTLQAPAAPPKSVKTVEYSIVVPVYNSEHTLDELCDRIKKTFGPITDNYEIILVDDCSADGSWQRMKGLHERDGRIRVIHLIKNFGQPNATVCGFNFCTGDYVITMDDDLQHPPEEIPKLIEKIKEGYMVVYGRYTVKMHGPVKNLTSLGIQMFMHRILGIPADIDITSFAIYRSTVVKNATSIKTAYPFLPALTSKNVPADKIANAEVTHNKRKAGRSNYNLAKQVKLTLNLLINHSSLPLLFIGVMGTLISLLSFCYGTLVVLVRLFDPSFGLTGWTSLMVVLCFLGGSILMALGIIGEYLRRILAELSHERQFIIEEMEV